MVTLYKKNNGKILSIQIKSRCFSATNTVYVYSESGNVEGKKVKTQYKVILPEKSKITLKQLAEKEVNSKIKMLISKKGYKLNINELTDLPTHNDNDNSLKCVL